MLDNRQSCDRHHIARQKRPLFFDGFDIFASAGLLGLVNPAAALGDEALGKTRRGMSGFTAAETRPYCADPSQRL
jgi:hypothetical protein